MKRHLIILIISAILYSCQSESPDVSPRLVVEGYYCSGGYPDVVVSLSVPAINEKTDVSAALLTAATVTIIDDTSGESTVLTGSASAAYLPPYHYYSHEMKGEPGRNYTITARYRNLVASSTAYMPYPTTIDSITQATMPSAPDMRALTLHFTAPDDCPAYYHISIKVEDINNRFVSAHLGIAEVYTPGQHISMPILRAWSFNSNEEGEDFITNFKPGQKLAVRLERIDRPAYEFWEAHANALLVGPSEFLDTSFSISGNIDGGYGIWSPSGADTKYVLVD